MTTSRFRVQGLDCAEEATALRGTVGKLPGVAELSFDVLRGMMVVEHDAATASMDRIVETVAGTGKWKTSNTNSERSAARCIS